MFKASIDLTKANEALVELGLDPYPLKAIVFELHNEEELQRVCKSYEIKFNEWALGQALKKK